MSSEITNPQILEKRVGASVRQSAPLVSIIIPAYNVAEFVAETLRSVAAQTFTDYETILVNDGSPDTAGLEKILAPYFESIVYLKQNNGGVSAARNTAIENARGQILAFLDGDDIWLPEYLESQVDFLAANNHEMVYCDALLFGENFHAAETFMLKAPSDGAVTPGTLLKTECNVITSGTLLLKEKILEHGFFDLNARRTEDFDMWFRLAKNHVKIAYQKKVLLKYRVRSSGLTGTSVERAERAVSALETVKRNNKLTDSETRIWHRQMKVFAAAVCLEKGKTFLVRKEFARARASLKEAIDHSPSAKLKFVSLLLAINPNMVLALFRKFRLPEFSLISLNDWSD